MDVFTAYIIPGIILVLYSFSPNKSLFVITVCVVYVFFLTLSIISESITALVKIIGFQISRYNVQIIVFN